MAPLPEGELRVRRRKPAQAPPRLLMREFPTAAPTKLGSEQSLDNLSSYSHKLVPVVEKEEKKKNLVSPPAPVSLAGRGFSLLSQSQADRRRCGAPSRGDEAVMCGDSDDYWDGYWV